MAYIFPNDYHLPFNCHIPFLPPDEFSFAWELNYLFFFLATTFASLFFISYMPLPLLLMNQTCWLLDMALMTADEMNKNLQLDDEVLDQERIKITNGHVKTFIERCEKIVEWRNEVQELLQWNFNVEFQIQAITLCFFIYFLSLNFFASFIVLNSFLVCLGQFFLLCWMGTRVKNRIDQLSYEISKNWYLMQPKQRKTIQMILHWTQSMNGFTGTFKEVNMETFQAVGEKFTSKRASPI